MYYIIYLLDTQRFEVVPENWIRDIETHYEKFLNNGLNKNQVHVCFWTNSTAVRDPNGVIRLDFAPDFNARLGSTFPADGCYLCKIIKAKGNNLGSI